MDNSKPQSPSLLGIFKESLKTIYTNIQVLIPILLVVIVCMSMLDLAENFILLHFNDFLGLKLAATNGYYLMFLLENHPILRYELIQILYKLTIYGELNATLAIILVKLIFQALYLCVTMISLVAIVSSSYEAYTAEVLGPNDVLFKIKTSWKKPLVTTFYLVLSSLKYILIIFILFVIDFMLTMNSTSLLYSRLVIHCAQILYLFEASRWMVCLVVSVLDEGVIGSQAVSRGRTLLTNENLKYLLLMFPLAVAYVVVGFVRDIGVTDSDLWWPLVTLTNGLDFLVTVFMYVVFTVYYHQVNTSYEDNEVKDHFYLPISGGEA